MKTIFIVDDQPEIKELLEMSLKGEDRRFFLIDNGERALSLAEKEPPDLVLLDVMMPGGIDGYEVAQKLKGSPRTRNCHIIMITARTQEKDRLNAFESGADDYLAKPFDLRNLINKVNAALA